MEILNVITKDVFESNVPAAKMPERNTSVFSRMQEMIKSAYQMLVDDVVSPEFEALLNDNLNMQNLAVRYVCLCAFVRTCRSLDLVLTATGFGIVSTESTAPASRARVDALIEEMTVEKMIAQDMLIQLLTDAEGWGDTQQAKLNISTLFYRPKFMKSWAGLVLTAQTWQKAKGLAATADTFLRNEISDEYMDELLQKVRTASLENADIIVMDKCNAFTGDFMSNYDLTHGMPNKMQLRALRDHLERFSDSYPTYVSSKLYAKRHAERYENRKEDPTFFFM